VRYRISQRPEMKEYFFGKKSGTVRTFNGRISSDFTVVNTNSFNLEFNNTK
jgi:hypothetical protein